MAPFAPPHLLRWLAPRSSSPSGSLDYQAMTDFTRATASDISVSADPNPEEFAALDLEDYLVKTCKTGMPLRAHMWRRCATHLWTPESSTLHGVCVESSGPIKGLAEMTHRIPGMWKTGLFVNVRKALRKATKQSEERF